mmetsp:Transcript_90766/g.189744  ORF Transcript_90766/g.189744 Transcript_90766/m.189744 type:complete len:233 (+) Transcript_90766:95-793(+)
MMFDAPEETSVVLTKTKMCMFHSRGDCRRGLACTFAHDPSELRHAPDLSRTKLCTSVLRGRKCYNRTCNFAHSLQELRLPGLPDELQSLQQMMAMQQHAQQHQGQHGTELGDPSPFSADPGSLGLASMPAATGYSSQEGSDDESRTGRASTSTRASCDNGSAEYRKAFLLPNSRHDSQVSQPLSHDCMKDNVVGYSPSEIAGSSVAMVDGYTHDFEVDNGETPSLYKLVLRF